MKKLDPKESGWQLNVESKTNYGLMDISFAFDY